MTLAAKSCLACYSAQPVIGNNLLHASMHGHTTGVCIVHHDAGL